MELRERMDKLKRKQKGFTLVELIVVIAIIGILAGVMLPRFFGFSDDARKAAAVAEAKSIRAVIETYYAENGRIPVVGTPSDDAPVTTEIEDHDGNLLFTAQGDLQMTASTTMGFTFVKNNGDAEDDLWQVTVDDTGKISEPTQT